MWSLQTFSKRLVKLRLDRARLVFSTPLVLAHETQAHRSSSFIFTVFPPVRALTILVNAASSSWSSMSS